LKTKPWMFLGTIDEGLVSRRH